MIITTSKKENYCTEIKTDNHLFYSDVPESHGGGGEYASPGELFAASYASCLNITTRMVLDRKQIEYDEVIVKVDIDDENLDDLKIYTFIDITGTISQEDKDMIINKVKRCPVGRMMRANKAFLDME